jgi:NADH-quinone oxidoreductase subunit N
MMHLAAGLPATEVAWSDLAPMLVLLGAAAVLMLLGTMWRRWTNVATTTLTVTAAALATVLAGAKWVDLGEEPASTIMSGALHVDRFAVFSSVVVFIVLAGASLLLLVHKRAEGTTGPELEVLFLTAAIGAVVMAAANDLIVLVLGLEILSLALYVLAASSRGREESEEAGLKYFILGGFASAFLLYGIALVYGSTGTTRISEVSGVLGGSVGVGTRDSVLLLGVGMLLVGLGFKVSAVPFQSWTPDVYQGSPSPVTAFMASAGKVGAFAALLRVMVTGLETRVDDWRPVVWLLALLSIVVGSALATVQTNVKRMLAYSSVAHAGFILVGLEAAGHYGETGLAPAMAYLAVYAVMSVGSFAAVMAAVGAGVGDLADLRGFSRRSPLLALAFSVLLFAQAGVPLTAGFVAKFGVIRAAVDSGSYAIAVAAMVAAVIGAYLYLRIVVSVWLEDGGTTERAHVPAPLAVVVVGAAGAVLVVGVWPQLLLGAADLIG